MRKIFTAVATLATLSAAAQSHEPMRFVGKASVSVMSQDVALPSDTITFGMNSMTSGDITFPEVQGGMGVIPSFTVKDVAFEMSDGHTVVFPEQTFTSQVNVDGEEKTVSGSSFSGTYDMTDHSLSLRLEYKYGSMPFATTYTIKGYYLKPVSGEIKVTVGGVYDYTNADVTYYVRKYEDGGEQLVDVGVPAYSLKGTVMGDLNLGEYTVCGLAYDETRQGWWRDYRNDGLSFSFEAVQNGEKVMSGDYLFNPDKDNNILVSYDGSNVCAITNTFQMGTMPFGIVSVFSASTTDIAVVSADKTVNATPTGVYGMDGTRLRDDAKGLVIVNGKKCVRK